MTAVGGDSAGNPGGLGRVRIERVADASTIRVMPDPSVVVLTEQAAPQIWLPDSGPVVRVVSIGGQAAPDDPRASFGATGADVVLHSITGTTVIVETTNVEHASVVQVRVSPRINGSYTETTATLDRVISEDPLVIRWVANVPVKDGYSAMQVKVVRP